MFRQKFLLALPSFSCPLQAVYLYFCLLWIFFWGLWLQFQAILWTLEADLQRDAQGTAEVLWKFLKTWFSNSKINCILHSKLGWLHGTCHMACLQKRHMDSNCRQKPWGSNCSPKWLRTETFFCRSLTANAKLAKSSSQQRVLSRQKSWQEFASLAKILVTVRLINRYTHRWESFLTVACQDLSLFNLLLIHNS